jgi:hypothetical protein
MLKDMHRAIEDSVHFHTIEAIFEDSVSMQFRSQCT